MYQAKHNFVKDKFANCIFVTSSKIFNWMTNELSVAGIILMPEQQLLLLLLALLIMLWSSGDW